MKEVTLSYKRKRKVLPIILIVILLLLIFLAAIPIKKAYDLSQFQQSLPSSEEVKEMNVRLWEDDTITFHSANYYSMAILQEGSSPGTLKNVLVGFNTINVLFMPAADDIYADTVLKCLNQGIAIRTLYVPKNTPESFYNALKERSFNGQVIAVEGEVYNKFADCGIYLKEGKESYSIQITHGDNTILYTDTEPVGSSFSTKDVTLAFLTANALEGSKLTAEYALFKDPTIDPAILSGKVTNYLFDYPSWILYGNSNGYEILLDTSFITVSP